MTVFISETFDCRKAKGDHVVLEETEWELMHETAVRLGLPVASRLDDYYNGYFLSGEDLAVFEHEIAAIASNLAPDSQCANVCELPAFVAAASKASLGLLFCCD